MIGENFGGLPVINAKATGNNIDRLRADYGLTPKDIQRATGVSLQAVYRWLRGTNIPTIDNLVILASMMDVTVDDLLIVDTV